MKYLSRVFLFNVFALWLTSEIIPALNIHGSWQAVLFAGFVLSLLMIIVKPILKILFIPINILTFGLLSWFINVIVLYLLTLLVSEVEVSAWTFPGFAYGGFTIPAYHLTYLLALITASLSITFISNFMHDISEG
jgi:putative membrane protein